MKRPNRLVKEGAFASEEFASSGCNPRTRAAYATGVKHRLDGRPSRPNFYELSAVDYRKAWAAGWDETDMAISDGVRFTCEHCGREYIAKAVGP